jgi:nitric oxide reductase NorD protein
MTPPDDTAAPSWDERLRGYREQLACGFPQVGEVFEDCMREALAVLSAEGVAGYLDTARFLGGMGRGVEPLLAFLEEWPPIAKLVGEAALPAVTASMHALWKSPNAKAITPFLQSLAAVARRLPSRQQLQRYLDLTQEFTARNTGSIHGIHQTFASPGLPDFLAQAPTLLNQLSISGLRNWVDYGIRNYPNHPERQRDYFSLKSADSRAVLQRERRGTLLVDKERLLDLYLRGLWGDSTQLVPYPADPDEPQQRPLPYYDASGIRLPDVLDDAHGVCRHRPLPRNPGSHCRPSPLEHADVRRQLQPDAAPGDRGFRRQPHRDAGHARLPRHAPHLPGPAPDAARRRLRPGNHLLPAVIA